MKVCTRCRIEKGITDFPPHKKNKDGKCCWCRTCHSEYNRLNYVPRIRKSPTPQDVIREHRRDYQREYRNRDDVNKLRHSVRSRMYAAFVGIGIKKSRKTEEMIGCSFPELEAAIGTRPGEGWHLDHICPLSQAKTVEEVLKLAHWSNVTWIKAEDNLKKRNLKTPEGEDMCLRLLGRNWL